MCFICANFASDWAARIAVKVCALSRLRHEQQQRSLHSHAQHKAEWERLMYDAFTWVASGAEYELFHLFSPFHYGRECPEDSTGASPQLPRPTRMNALRFITSCSCIRSSCFPPRDDKIRIDDLTDRLFAVDGARTDLPASSMFCLSIFLPLLHGEAFSKIPAVLLPACIWEQCRGRPLSFTRIPRLGQHSSADLWQAQEAASLNKFQSTCLH
jgi:hypothetical protein